MREFYWAYANRSSAPCAKILKPVRESSQRFVFERGRKERRRALRCRRERARFQHFHAAGVTTLTGAA